MYTVIKDFHDIKNMKHVFKVGENFESEEPVRIDSLINRGLIEGAKVPSFDSMTKKELIELLEQKEIEFDEKQTKAELVELLQGGD